MSYHVERYDDAHDDEPAEREVFGNAVPALVYALHEALNLYSEGGEYRLGTAGESELFEVYPELGYGTVVVATASYQHRGAE